MANENMVVITALSQKGGGGKTSLLIAFASVMDLDDKKVLLIDTDAQRSIGAWADHCKSEGIWSDNLVVQSASNTADLEALIDDAYEAGDVDFVLVDTVGTFEEGHLDVISLSDYVFMPLKLGSHDRNSSQATLEWYQDLEKQVAREGGEVPPFGCVINDVPLNLTQRQKEVMAHYRATFPTVPTPVRNRAAILELNTTGPARPLLADMETRSDRRLSVLHMDTALEEIGQVLRELLLKQRHEV